MGLRLYKLMRIMTQNNENGLTLPLLEIMVLLTGGRTSYEFHEKFHFKCGNCIHMACCRDRFRDPSGELSRSLFHGMYCFCISCSILLQEMEG